MNKTKDAGVVRAVRKLLDIDEAAELLGVHYATLYRWTKTGKIPCIRMGARIIRFDERALAEFLAKHTQPVAEVRSGRPA